MIIKRPGVYVRETPSPPPIEGVDTSTAAFVGPSERGPVGEPVRLASWIEYTATFGDRTGALGLAVAGYFRNGGTRAVVVRTPGSGAQDYLAESGLGVLEGQDFALLCLAADRPGDDVPAVVWPAAAEVCVRRRAFLIMDAPAATPAVEVADWVSGLGLDEGARPYAAVYAPRLQEPTDDQAATLDVAPSGAVAGVMARTDATHGVWRSPGGSQAELRGVAGLAEDLSQQQLQTLNAAGVNGLRVLPGLGPVIWGARTTAGRATGAPEWAYVSIRRYLIWLEESLDEGLGWAVFEPNAEPLWASVRRQVGTFLESQRRSGALAGSRPQDAAFVHCGPDTMTQADLDAGVLVVQVGFAPLRPAEFVVVDIRKIVGRSRPWKPRDRIDLRTHRRLLDLLTARRGGAASVHVSLADAGPEIAAQEAAGRGVHRVDLSEVASTWLGETEKNLAALFDAAERSGAVLLFDEADALFGKRTDVGAAADRYKDQAIDFLLRRLEDPHPPVIIIGGSDVVDDTPEDRDPA